MTTRPIVLSALLLAACARDEGFSGTFDTPGPLAVLDVEGTPFDRPVGYAADQHGGRIRVLDLVTGRYLADDPFASFLRGAELATGDQRVLAAIAAHAPSPTEVVVWAIDRRFGQLLRVPHVIGVGERGFPIEATPEVVDVTFHDVGDADDVVVEGLALQPDRATSETWIATWDGEVWQITGSRSGAQPPAFFNVPWSARNGALTLVLRGTASVGDAVEITIDAGIDEFDLPGTPLDLALAPDGSVLALTWQEDDGQTLALADPDDGARTPVGLDAGAAPHTLAFAPDAPTLFATDTALPVVWEVDTTTGAVTRHDLPFRVQHVAALSGDAGRLLYLAPVDRSEVWILDLDEGDFVDVNAAAPGVQGMTFDAPVLGLAPVDHVYDFPSDDEDVQPRGKSVAVSLQAGQVVWMQYGDGCLVRDALGPRTEASATALFDLSIDPEFLSPDTVFLQPIEDGLRHVVVNPCAGTAPSEIWELRFDAVRQGWVVEGRLSGVQEALAREDERYVSDGGEISFLLRGGTTPSEDGWRFLFSVLSGALVADGDNNGDGVRELDIDLPGRPVVFLDRGSDGERVPKLVVPVQASDFVVKVDPRNGLVEALWD